jgi:uncharacterized protein (DUF1501 family)
MQRRRDFLKTMAATPFAMSAGSMASMFAAAPACATDVSGYKALVCVFLFGGMDCHDTVLPVDASSYSSLAQIRSPLLQSYAALAGGTSRDRSSLLALNPATADFGARRFGLPPEMAGLHALFEQGDAAIVGNVGPLLAPTTAADYFQGTVDLPARLFSHNDQQSTWMSFGPEGSQLGWGGLFGDAAVQAGANAEGIFSQVSVAGNSVFLTGNAVSAYQISPEGVPSIGLIDAAGDRFNATAQARVRDHFIAAGDQRVNLFERDLVNLSRISLDANDLLDTALQSRSTLNTAFPASPLGGQLRAVAQTISVRQSLGASRQVFFVALGGFDTHSAQANDLPGLQQDVGDSIAAFFAATQELGVAQDVTTFTAADFGRTLTVNGDGTDHGWGSHHFVVGGAVKGGDIYGDIPPPVLGHSQDAGNGRLIPTTSVEQFAYPLGRWFGLSEASLTTALPGLARFSAAPPAFI